MQITVGETLKMAKDAEREIQRLNRQRLDEAFVYHDKDEEPEMPSTGVPVLTDKIMDLSAKVRLLRKKAAEANLTTRLDYPPEGPKLTLAEGITLLSQLLRERESVQRLIGEPERKRESFGIAGGYHYRTATYDLEKMTEYAQQLDESIRKLRTSIDRANVNTFIELTPEESEIVNRV